MTDNGRVLTDQALVPTASSQQAVSTEGFDPSREAYALATQLDLCRITSHRGDLARLLDHCLDRLDLQLVRRSR